MNQNQPIINLLKRLWHHISPHRRRQLFLLLLLTLLTSFAEILSIGVVIPFLGALTSPDRIFELQAAQPIIHILKLTEPSQLLFPLTIAFIASAIFAGVLRMLMIWTSNKVSFITGADLSIDIYRRTLYQPYAVHCSRNSSEVINGISGKVNGIIYYIIAPFLTLISSSVILVGILIVMLVVEPFTALAAFAGFGVIYAFIILSTRNRLLTNSQISAIQSSKIMKSLQEGLGSIRDVLINGSQVTYCQIYSNADQPLRRAQGNTQFLSIAPRYAMEGLGMILIAIIAFSLSKQPDGLVKAIPILGALVLCAQRLLPILQQCYFSWSSIQGAQVTLQDVLELLDQPLPEPIDPSMMRPLPFNHNINIKELSFRYNSQTPYVLKHLSLTIFKGSRVGFIGKTGSGKSTLLDIIMGLLKPTDGLLEIDGEKVSSANCSAWQSHIAHVPQTIFLMDSSIEENIAFGIPKDQIDLLRVRQAAQQAQIAKSIESWPKQYQTIVGERGIKLSGGQRQRIGIARALYKKADVIIFDEATSALDNETEEAVMSAIESLSQNLTVLIIAHRLTTLKNCSQIVELADGSIKRIVSYPDIMKKHLL
jgi:ATP-binding cassette, subfamily B, bacterial PglK